MEGREERSAKLRNTELIAKLCGFTYSTKTHVYGGFFTGFQCETIAKTIEGLQARVTELENAVALAKAKAG